MARPDEVSKTATDKAHPQTDSTQSKGTNANAEAQVALKNLKIDVAPAADQSTLAKYCVHPVEIVDDHGKLKLDTKKPEQTEQTKPETKQKYEITADGKFQLTQTDFPDGTSRKFHHDEKGNVDQITEPSGDEYVKSGNKWLKVVDGQAVHGDYDVSVNKDGDVTVKNPDGSTQKENHDGSTVDTKTTIGPDGKPTTEVDVDHALGKGKAKYHLDANGNVDDVVKADGQHWHKNNDGTWKEEIPAHVDANGKLVPARTLDHQKMKVSLDKETGDLDWVNNPGTKNEQHSRTTHDGTYIKDVQPELHPIPPQPEKPDQMTVNEAHTVSALLEIMSKDKGSDREDDRQALQSTLDDINKQGPEQAQKVYDAMSEM